MDYTHEANVPQSGLEDRGRFDAVKEKLGQVGRKLKRIEVRESIVAHPFAAIGIGAAMYQPAWGATVPEVVPRSDLVQAIALNGIGFSGDIGYEWRLSDSLGLDLGGRIELHNVRGDGEQLSTASIGVLLGVTYF